MRLPPGTASKTAVLLSCACLLGLPGCGGSGSPSPGPTPMPPVVSAISPDAGSTAGSTVVIITGQNFKAGATVTVAGAAASDVVVQSATSLTARTAAHAAGTGNVVVTVEGRAGTLTNGFTYAVPGPSNNPAPVISALTARGSQKNQPASLADLGETLTLTAAVTDGESRIEDLVFEWTAEQGTLSGSGQSVTWKAPTEATLPLAVHIGVTVIERYVTNDTAVPQVRENKVSDTTTVDVHDSAKEVGDMATRFLQNFSQSTVPVDVVMRDFLPECYGTADERQDVEDNRQYYTITSWSVGEPSVTINFGGTCPLRSRHGDACSSSEVRWESIEKTSGDVGGVTGVDQVAAVYRDRRWWLCDSQFDGKPLTTARGFYELLTR